MRTLTSTTTSGEMRKLRDAGPVGSGREALGVGELVSGVAHELNNPLTAVVGYAELLRSERPTKRPGRT